MIAAVGDVDESAGHCDTKGELELSVAGSSTAPLANELAIGGAEHLHTMIAAVGDVDESAGHCDTKGALELSVAGSSTAPLANELAIGGAEHLHTMIAVIGDVDESAGHCDTIGALELSVTGSVAAPLEDEVACMAVDRRVREIGDVRTDVGDHRRHALKHVRERLKVELHPIQLLELHRRLRLFELLEVLRHESEQGQRATLESELEAHLERRHLRQRLRESRAACDAAVDVRLQNEKQARTDTRAT
jgi:hypothetical protein